MAARRVTPALLRRSNAPIHNSMSGLTGFFTSTGTSVPCSESAKACIAKGLAVVRAPIHRMSMPYFMASSTCSGVATSVATIIPVLSFTFLSQPSAGSPCPSKQPGLVRGFQAPARNIWHPFEASCKAVVITCSSVSALHGPAMINGRSLSLGRFSGLRCISIYFSIIYCFNIAFILRRASSIFASVAQSEMRT